MGASLSRPEMVSNTGRRIFHNKKSRIRLVGKVPFLSARDMYYDGKGYMKVKLLSAVKIVDAKGKELDQGLLFAG